MVYCCRTTTRRLRRRTFFIFVAVVVVGVGVGVLTANYKVLEICYADNMTNLSLFRFIVCDLRFSGGKYKTKKTHLSTFQSRDSDE